MLPNVLFVHLQHSTSRYDDGHDGPVLEMEDV